MRKMKYCPYCGQGKNFDCRCEYGSLMKMKMEPNEKQKGLFSKKFCPNCGSKSTATPCRNCGISFSNDDFWMVRLW